MVKSVSLHTTTDTPPEKESTQNERLIVRWKTCTSSPDNGSIKAKPLYRGIGPREQVNRFRDWLSGNLKGGDEEFAGLFIFEFDKDGRIVAHTIEHAEEGGGADRASRVVNLTDWLIGRAKGKEKIPDLAWIVQGKDRRDRTKR
ncbi:MAG: hypothetical protein Q9167_006711 [Letrouitia subvulpina]